MSDIFSSPAHRETPADVLPDALASQLDDWRALMATRPGVAADDVDELTDHLLTEVRDLRARGLHADEAFLIAVKRLGAQDDISREYAQVHSDRLWRQLILSPGESAAPAGPPSAAMQETSPRSLHALPVDLLASLILGLGAGLAVRLPYEVLGEASSEHFYLRNIAFLVLPFLIAFFLIGHARTARAQGGDSRALVHHLGGPTGLGVVGAVMIASAVLVNIYPGAPDAQTLVLTAIHLPVALVVLTGIASLGARWRRLDAWMDWTRFLGEAAVYYVLIALCGGLLMGILVSIFTVTDLPPATLDQIISWVIPMGAAGAVLVCAWLVERKKSVVENMAPVLTSVFTPLLTIVLVAFLVVVAVTGGPVDMDRQVLITFDAVLVAVAAIVLFTVSARPSGSHDARALDWMQLALIVAAILVDLIMLWAMAGRLAAWGTTPNKIAGLGCNVLLLAHLAGSAWQYWRICIGHAPSRGLERWQCLALPVFGTWTLLVALVFPPAFNWA